MKRALLFLTICSAWLSAQTIVQPLFRDSAVTVTTAGSLIKNYGQSSHQVALHIGAQPTKTCSSPSASGDLQYSFDNSTWITFGSPQGKITPTVTDQIFSGSGVYSYIRFRLTGMDTANCQATAWYSATVAGSGGPAPAVGPTPVGSGLKLVANQPWTQAPVFVGGIGGSGFATPLLTCDQTAFGSAAAGGRALLVATDGTGARTRVCSVVVSGAAGAGVTFTTGTGTTCLTGTQAVTQIIQLAATDPNPIAWGSGLGQIFASGAATDLCISVSGATAYVTISYAQGGWY